MRLFVAVDPPPPVVAGLRAVLPAGLPADAELRWVPPEQWHLTLAFLGEVDPAALPELTERLGRAAGRSAAIALAFSGAGTFPRSARRARVLWCGVGGEVAELSRLAEQCAAAARRSGIEVEERRYRPHLTLARSRAAYGDMTGPLSVLRSYVGPSWCAGEIRLMRSELGPPVRHHLLRAWPLGSTPPPVADRDRAGTSPG